MHHLAQTCAARAAVLISEMAQSFGGGGREGFGAFLNFHLQLRGLADILRQQIVDVNWREALVDRSVVNSIHIGRLRPYRYLTLSTVSCFHFSLSKCLCARVHIGWHAHGRRQSL